MNRFKTIGLHLACIALRPATASFHIKGVARALFTAYRTIPLHFEMNITN